MHLPDDVLLEIFTLNARVLKDPPLFRRRHISGAPAPSNYPTYPTNPLDAWTAISYIRSSSQVCQLWRRVILQSSIIWGQLLNINYLRQCNDCWRKEVLRRTGVSPLHVVAEVFFNSPDKLVAKVNDYLLSILDHQWHRIRLLHLRVHDLETDVSRRASQLLQRPAPWLRSFRLEIVPIPWNTAIDTPCCRIGTLFAHDAPSLHDYFSWNLHDFHPDALRMSSLRILKVQLSRASPLRIKYSLFELLNSISQMKNLEEISLEFYPSPRQMFSIQDSPLPYAHLPNLKSIQLTTDTRTFFDFVKSISGSTGWNLAMCPHNLTDDDDFTKREISMILDTTSHYVAGYLMDREPVTLSVAVTEYGLILEASPGEHLDHAFHLSIPNSHHLEHYIPKFLGAFYTNRLYSTRNLTVIAGFPNLDVPKNDLSAFIDTCIEVDTLEVDLPTLELFNMALASSTGYFPKLMELKIWGFLEAGWTHIFIQFMLGRHIGYLQQVERVIFTENSEEHSVDFTIVQEALQGLDGLEIIWPGDCGRRHSIVCGRSSDTLRVKESDESEVRSQ